MHGPFVNQCESEMATATATNPNTILPQLFVVAAVDECPTFMSTIYGSMLK